MIELRTLGGLDLHDAQGDEHRVISAAPKPAALLTYLAIATPRGFHRRDTLLALLWPELDQEHARGALRQALHVIRRSMTAGALLTEGDEKIAVDRDLFWCDAVAFELLLDGGKEEEALELYRGALLDGFHLSGCLEFERWLDDERRRLGQRAAEATWSLAQQALADGRTAQATQWGRRALAFSPDDEGVLRRVIDLLDRLGDRAGAIREYEAFAKRLQEDYEADPAPETTELIAAVRARVEANGSVPASAPLAKPPVEAALASVTTQPHAFWRTRGRAVAAIVVLGAITAVGASVMRNGRGESPDLDPRLVLVRPFSNETGRPELDRLGTMAADWISQGLAETGVVRVVATMPIGANAEIDPAIAPAESGSMRNAGTTVSGSFYSVGDSVSFQTQIVESAGGEVLASVGPVLASVRDPRGGVEELRRRTTGALASVVDPLLASWVTATRPPPSYEAYQLFAQGFDAFFGAAMSVSETGGDRRDMRARYLTAADYFRRAADLDSTYALPLLWEVYARSNGGDREGRRSTLDELTGRRNGLTRWEQHLLDSFVGPDLPSQYAALSRLVAMTPGSEWNFKLAQKARGLGRLEEAVTLLEEVTDQGWLAMWPSYWPALTDTRHMLGQYERELQDIASNRARFPDRVRATEEIRPLAALGRVEEALLLVRFAGDFSTLVSELYAHGHYEAAQSVIRNHLPRIDLIDGTWGDYDARVLLWLGRHAEAENSLRAILEEFSPGYSAWIFLAEVVLAKGDREEAVRIFNHVSQLQPGISNPNRSIARAMILMHLGDRAGAVEVMSQEFSLPSLRIMLHRWGRVPQAMADYAPFQELTGWPPPLPN